jgi:hypothetical protein
MAIRARLTADGFVDIFEIAGIEPAALVLLRDIVAGGASEDEAAAKFVRQTLSPLK